MKKGWILSVTLCLILAGLGQAVAQSTFQRSLPRVLWIFREDVKPARGSMHEKVEHGFAQFWEKAQVQPFLALEAVSGNANEVMFLSGYGSFESFEKDFQTFTKAQSGPMKAEYEALARQEADLVNSTRSTVAIYRDDLSYLGHRFMRDLPKARYLSIETMRVRPGKAEAFADGAKLFQSAYTKAGIEDPFAIYQVTSGAAEGTYLIFSQLQSLKALDEEMAQGPKVMQSMGEENWKNLMKGAGDVLMSQETQIYSFNPAMSNVSAEFAAVDPDFWNPKPEMLAKATTGEKKSKNKK